MNPLIASLWSAFTILSSAAPQQDCDASSGVDIDTILTTNTPNCETFAKQLGLAKYKATVSSARQHAAQSANISSVGNSIPFCEINFAISYGDNDTLNAALWLPSNAADYQGRFLAVGNGGMAGTIDNATMLAQLNSGAGYAIAAGDAGHRAADNNNGGGAPGVYLPYLHDQDQVEAWIHNAISLFTPAARAIVQKYYGQKPKYSYYAGCSTGGAQGFALAQFHPGLFDGIYAGSPGNWYSHLALSFLWNAQKTNTTATMLTGAELNFTTNAVLDACDTLDGVKDRLLENPLNCHFDVGTLACKGTASTTSSSTTAAVTCISPTKIAAMKSIYSGAVRSDNGRQIYPGFCLGSETQWLLQEGPLASLFTIPILQNLVFNSLKYDSSTFNWASDVDAVNAKAGRYIDEISPNLKPFVAAGGKMVTTQGWADPFNAATWPIEHLQQLKTGSGNVDEFYKLFMVPGGGHCGAATTYPHVPANYFGTVLKGLVAWVENGTQPASVVSTDPPDGSNTTRLLCAWPETAQLVGDDQNKAEDFECR